MYSRIYLKLAGVDGEVTDGDYKGWIEILSWSHSFSQPTSPPRSQAGTGTVEQANHSDFTLGKYMDSATPALLKACWSGKIIPSAKVRLQACEADKMTPTWSIEMDNVVVSSIALAGGCGDQPIETVTLAYSAVQYAPTAKPESRRMPAVKHDLRANRVE